MYNTIGYEGVVTIEEINRETGEIVQSKCFNNLTPHGLQIVNNGGIWGIALNSIHSYMNEGATYVLSGLVHSLNGVQTMWGLGDVNNYAVTSFISMNPLNIVGYNLESEPIDKRFPPHLNGDLSVDMEKVHWYGVGNNLAPVGGKEAKLVEPRIKSNDGVRRICTYEVSAVGTTNAISIVIGDITKPYKGGQSATVITPTLKVNDTVYRQMDAFFIPGVLVKENEMLFGTLAVGALGVLNLDDGSYYWLEDGDRLKELALSAGNSAHCILDNKVYFHNSGKICSLDLNTLAVQRVSSPNYNYNSHVGTDGEYIYVWNDGGYCYKYSKSLGHLSSSAFDYDVIALNVPTGFKAPTSIVNQHGSFYVYWKALNLVVKCTDILNIKESIVGYYSSNSLCHVPVYNCFLGTTVVCDFPDINSDGTVFFNGGIKKIPDTGGSQFNFIWDVKCSDGTPFTVQSSDNPVYVSYGFRGSNA